MDDLISEFIAETGESLGLLDLELVKLEQDPGNQAILSNIFRIVHTIKGTSGFLGLPRLGKVAHASENVLGMIRDGKLEATPEAISIVLESLDQIKTLLDYLGEHSTEPEGSDADLIVRLDLFVEGKPAESTETPAAEESAPQDFSHFFAGDDDLEALAKAEGKSLVASTTAVAKVVEPPMPVLAALEAPKTNPPATIAKPSAAEKTPPKEGKDAPAAANQSIRVNIDVLENLMQMVSELVLNRNQLMQIVRSHAEVHPFLQSPIQQMSYITSELQEGIMKTRMQPIGTAWAKFPRLVRDLSIEVHKKIELRMYGEDTELDRQLLEMIKDPLTHMVRNSCDHGLETPADRVAAGKSEIGVVTLSAFHEGGHIIIEIAYDGRGLNIERIKQKALANGLATASELESQSQQQIMQYIFRAGFSTAEAVTSVSGRGVGMDVVRTNIEKMGGTIELSSELGKGSTFSIKIPLTLAIVSVLIVESKGQKFAIPQINVRELVAVAPESEYMIEGVNNAPVLRLRDKLVPLGSLGEILDLQTQAFNWEEQSAQVALCRVGAYNFGLIVDRVHDTEEIVVKPVAERLKSIPYYSGNTILGDGSVIMILDPNGIAQAISHGNASGNSQAANPETNNTASENLISFLMFHAGKGAPKIVPLELISRLEEIEVTSIEPAGDTHVVQYRDDLMQLVSLQDTLVLPESGMVQVVVFTYDRKNIGLVVDSIIDIVSAPYKVKMGSRKKFCLGSMVVKGKTVDCLDVASLLSDLVDMAVSLGGSKKRKIKDICNVLLVEDSPFFRNITEPFLAAAGYIVTTAEHGQEALTILAQHPGKFDMIISDLEMPVMDGYELAKRCREDATLVGLPIVAYTASMNQEAIVKTKECGMDGCILKTDRLGLLEAISELLAVGKGEAA